MRFPFRQSWQLRVIERGRRRSGPHLAVMLAIFARLNAGEAIVSRIVRTVLTAPFAAKSAPHQIRSPRR